MISETYDKLSKKLGFFVNRAAELRNKFVVSYFLLFVIFNCCLLFSFKKLWNWVAPHARCT